MMPRLRAIVALDHSDRVQCQNSGCGHSVYAAVHVVEDGDRLLVLGSTCFIKRYGGASALGAAQYGGAGGRKLTALERAMLVQNTAALLAHFEAQDAAARRNDLQRLESLRLQHEQRAQQQRRTEEQLRTGGRSADRPLSGRRSPRRVRRLGARGGLGRAAGRRMSGGSSCPSPAPAVDKRLAELFRNEPDPFEPLAADQGLAQTVWHTGTAKLLTSRGRLVQLECGHFVVTKALHKAACPRCGEMIRAGWDHDAFRRLKEHDTFSWPGDPLRVLHETGSGDAAVSLAAALAGSPGAQ